MKTLSMLAATLCAVLLAYGTATASPIHSSLAQGNQSTVVGDANCDSRVHSIDALVIKQFVARLVQSLPCQNNADANLSGAVSIADAFLVLRFHAGMIPSLPMSGPRASIESRAGTLGHDVTVELRAKVPNPGLGAWTVDTSFDQSVVRATACTAGRGGICNFRFGPATVRTVGASAPGLLGDTTLGTLTFQCVAHGSSALNIRLDVFADSTIGNPQPLEDIADVQNGAITCG